MSDLIKAVPVRKRVKAEFTLDANEKRLIQAFRNLNLKTQSTSVQLLEAFVLMPSSARHKSPSLRLIVGGVA